MSKEFKIILIIFAVITVICGIVYFSVGNSKSIEKNASEDTSSKSEIPKGIAVTSEDISIEDEVLYVSFTVKNTSKKDINLEEVNIIVTDNEDNTISNVTVPIDKTLSSKEKIQLFSSDEVSYTGKDMKTTYKFKTK